MENYWHEKKCNFGFLNFWWISGILSEILKFDNRPGKPGKGATRILFFFCLKVFKSVIFLLTMKIYCRLILFVVLQRHGLTVKKYNYALIVKKKSGWRYYNNTEEKSKYLISIEKFRKIFDLIKRWNECAK